MVICFGEENNEIKLLNLCQSVRVECRTNCTLSRENSS